MPPRRTSSRRRLVQSLTLLLVALGSAACLADSRRGMGLQYIAVGRDAIAGSGFGLGAYELRKTSEEPGWFVDLHGATDGKVPNDTRAPDGYDGSQDQVVDRMTSILSLNVGPTLRLFDWLHAYGGVGVGVQWDSEIRFDGTLTASPDGTYRTTANRSTLLSSSFGVQVPLGDASLLGIGYDTLLEGPVFTLGLIW